MKKPARTIFGRLLRHSSGLFGIVILATVVIMALAAGIFFPNGPFTISGPPRSWPGAVEGYPLGTDALGRNMLASLLYGARVSLAVGATAAAVSLVIGTLVGAIAGYYGGTIDDILMRLTDAMQTIPSFLASIAIVGVLGASMGTIISAIAIVSWPMIARLVRADFLRLRTYDFVQSCRIIGMSDIRIIFQQILPNCLAPIIVSASVLVATAIITEASLAFLGLGDPNVMSWGTILSVGRPELRAGWYMTALPAGALVLTVLALNLIGDALNDVLNPRLKERS
ncbi:oligopeptide/dipeptide ABC transporter permease component protein [Ketogulonicigenium robustum]|uniref:Oligopeptide/dipeptide ABC transporter permease component protein n=1 Tax=Ketogulonicigenium robustum TaxID=92947 RepID=A0A1W6NW08_9RHOB|nr:ABC transporter permease [Ketogulonicigenium robustum]ARO13405.1 oligopeptide/dipeptide ABC transporter permease component protein [Ketogulonicigenium robustum]